MRMLYFIVGAAVFLLYALYDLNSVLWKVKVIQSFFALGSVLLLFSTVFCLWNEKNHLDRGLIAGVFVAIAVIFLILMVYSLFFALPFDKTYVHPNSKNPVYDRGMYALCRHPGVVWFCLMYVALACAWSSPTVWAIAVFYSVLNILYVVFQDVWTFPRTFDDYEGYRKRVPFLIPTPESIRTAFSTRR